VGVGALGAANDAMLEPWFVMVTDRQGQTIWARNFPGKVNNRLYVRWDGDGVVVGGSFDTELDVGLGPAKATGPEDLFVARFDANGTPSWSQHFGSDYHNALGAISSDAQRRTVVSGATIGFNQPTSLAGTTLGKGTWETFVAMFDERGTPSWARGIQRNNAGAPYAPLSSTVDETGAIFFAGLSDSLSGIYVGKLVP
jgi:hypothetical protein